MMEFDDGEVPVEDMVQCNTCKRSFFPKVLEKHAKICQKSAAKKRKVFDSSRQRAEGTDIPTLKPIKPKAEPPKKPKVNWRKKHEDFIATIRAAKTLTQVMKDGGPLPPPPPPTYDPDYIQCPYCQRRFSENAADRHIKFCREQAARIPNKSKLGDVKKTPAARTQFKPSAPVKKANPPAPSPSPAASSRLPQRSPLGQSIPNPSSKMSYAGSMRNNPSSLTSPPSGAGSMNRAVSSNFGPVRTTQSRIALNKKVDTHVSRKKDDDDDGDIDDGGLCPNVVTLLMNDVDGANEVGNGGTKSKVCPACGTKYPVESAKFCCECGVRRMCI